MLFASPPIVKILSFDSAQWEWDLATGRIRWNEGLAKLFGYSETVTDAAWRESRIHPEDRERVQRSLQRATIENHGRLWSETHRFRRASGAYAEVRERAFVVNDSAGPCRVVGAITSAPDRTAL